MINSGNAAQVMPSMVNYISHFIPRDPFNPILNPVNQRLTWAQALQLPGDNVFKRIYWAAIVFDGLRAEAINYQIIQNNILVFQAEQAKEMASSDNAMTDKSQQYADTPMAGELDANYNSPDAMDELKKTDETKRMIVLAAKLANIYKISTAEIQEQLGINDPGPDMTDNELQEWLEQNQGEQYDEIRSYMLNGVAEYGQHFDLQQMNMADQFLNRMTAMVMNAKKTIGDLEKLDPMLFANAFDKHFTALSALASDMVSEATQLIHKAGATPVLEPPRPEPSFKDNMDEQLAKMGAPDLSKPAEMEPAHRMDQLRLAAIKIAYPKAPTPQNAQRRELKPEPEQTSHEAVKSELEHYAKVLGVAMKTLGKAADQTLLRHLWPKDNPSNAAVREAMHNNPLQNEPIVKRKSIMQREMEASMKPNRDIQR